MLIRFGTWEEILEEPDYPKWRLVSLAGLRLALQQQEREPEAEELNLRLASVFDTADTRPLFVFLRALTGPDLVFERVGILPSLPW